MKTKKCFKEYIFESINGFPPVKVVFSDKFLRELHFLTKLPVKSVKQQFTLSEKQLLRKLEKDLIKYFSGIRANFKKYRINFSTGTDFQKKVWKAIQTITYGQTCSYKCLAGKIGNSKSVRAVGNACGKNPLPIIIPCHRIIASNGSLGGYSAGIDLKMQLLHLERVTYKKPVS